jgi:hypothetical protein
LTTSGRWKAVGVEDVHSDSARGDRNKKRVKIIRAWRRATEDLAEVYKCILTIGTGDDKTPSGHTFSYRVFWS